LKSKIIRYTIVQIKDGIVINTHMISEDRLSIIIESLLLNNINPITKLIIEIIPQEIGKTYFVLSLEVASIRMRFIKYENPITIRKEHIIIYINPCGEASLSKNIITLPRRINAKTIYTKSFLCLRVFIQ
jgi:hypothetical protein